MDTIQLGPISRDLVINLIRLATEPVELLVRLLDLLTHSPSHDFEAANTLGKVPEMVFDLLFRASVRFAKAKNIRMILTFSISSSSLSPSN